MSLNIINSEKPGNSVSSQDFQILQKTVDITIDAFLRIEKIPVFVEVGLYKNAITETILSFLFKHNRPFHYIGIHRNKDIQDFWGRSIFPLFQKRKDCKATLITEPLCTNKVFRGQTKVVQIHWLFFNEALQFDSVNNAINFWHAKFLRGGYLIFRNSEMKLNIERAFTNKWLYREFHCIDKCKSVVDEATKQVFGGLTVYVKIK